MQRDNVVFDFFSAVDSKIVNGDDYEDDTHNTNKITSKEFVAEDTLIFPIVIHIIHNPKTPEEKITEAQINQMLLELNEAYLTTKDNQVREEFKDVIGNAKIKFTLAKENPEGGVTNGLVYYESDEDYHRLVPNSDYKVRYAFKFNEDGSRRAWDNSKYINIFVLDLGGFDAKSNIGGFVTNPEPNSAEEFDTYKRWLLEQDTKFWSDWVKTEEGKALDGLTIDTWYTFGGASARNPKATFTTAIHELGHYFGLRHPNITILENADQSLVLVDDGFEDTPFTHYSQYFIGSCDNEVRQCGNLVQTENYMDYVLDCACMFTLEQAAFMRTFIENVRPEFFEEEDVSTEEDIRETNIIVYPNPAKENINIEGDYEYLRILTTSAQVVVEVNNSQSVVSIGNLKPGLYLMQFTTANGQSIVKKLLKL